MTSIRRWQHQQIDIFTAIPLDGKSEFRNQMSKITAFNGIYPTLSA